MEEVSINLDKYSNFILEIKKFIETKRKQPISFKGTVEKIDEHNNILTIRLQSTKRPYISKDSLILIKNDTPEITNIDAIVEDFHNSSLKVKIDASPSQFENKRVVIDIESRNVVLKILHKIIENIKNGKISLDNERVLDFMINKRKPSYGSKESLFISKKINEDQKESVVSSIKARDFHLIIGPPGTGKTYVIEELIRQFTKRNQKLLVTAWTNLAVDNIIKRLSGKETKNIVRIGPINEIDSEVRKFSIFEKMKEHKDWIEVEIHHKVIDKLFKLIPRKKDELNSVQENISHNKNITKIFEMELEKHITEKQKYDKLISIPINKRPPVNLSF